MIYIVHDLYKMMEWKPVHVTLGLLLIRGRDTYCSEKQCTNIQK